MYKNIEKNEMIVTTDMDNGEVVCLDVTTGEYYGIKDLGLEIWNLLSETDNEDEILGKLLEEYDATEEQMQSDVREFLFDLKQNGLVMYDEA